MAGTIDGFRRENYQLRNQVQDLKIIIVSGEGEDKGRENEQEAEILISSDSRGPEEPRTRQNNKGKPNVSSFYQCCQPDFLKEFENPIPV
jgi:hypothetical protein